MSDAYRTITVRFRGIAPSGKAIFVDKPATAGAGTVSIPRSLIHGVDDIALARAVKGAEVTFRLVEWKAEEVGFA